MIMLRLVLVGERLDLVIVIDAGGARRTGPR
jgi:hypothetical protein